MDDLLRVCNLKVVFDLPEGRLEAVRDVSFRIQPASTVALVGESGSGKSVVSQAIMRILPKAARITNGKVHFADPAANGRVVDIVQLNPGSAEMRAIRGGRISIVFQEPMSSLSPLHTVGDQVGEALRLHRTVSAAEGQALTLEMLRLVGFPDPVKILKTYPFELSGGLRQRAMIAMALICRPALLIADEPTTALDVTIQAQVLKLLKEIQQELGMSVMVITHDLGVVANLAQEVVVMYGGEVMERGVVDDIFRRPEHPYLKALLRAVPRLHMQPGERLQSIREVEHHDSRTVLPADDLEPLPSDPSVPLLKVEGVTKRFAIRKGGWFDLNRGTSVLAIDSVSLEIMRGECLGLVGESGCGKTTLAKVVMRAVTADSGRVTYNSRGQAVDVLALKGDQLTEYRRRVQFIFQDPFSSLNPRMTVFDIISEPLIIHEIGSAASRSKLVKALTEVVGLDVRHLRRYPHSFSGGQRQRIGIARALALRPDLLICDEPVSALDVSIQAQILNLLRDLKDELGLTYLFISHNLAVIDYIADRIAVMCRGRLVEVAPRQVLFRNPIHPYTRALIAAIPEPDPSCQLNLDALMAGRASDPSAWPAPFTVTDSTRLAMVDLGGSHFVKADPSSGARMAARC